MLFTPEWRTDTRSPTANAGAPVVRLRTTSPDNVRTEVTASWP